MCRRSTESRPQELPPLDRAGVEGPFDLFLDLGCFHILPDQARRLYCASITKVAAPDARLLIFAFSHNKHVLGPRGAERNEIEQSFASGWDIVWTKPETDLPYRTPRGATATWYLLRRTPLAGKT